MKKIATILTALALMLSLAACGDRSAPETPPTPTSTQQDTRTLAERMTEILTDVPDLPASFDTELDQDNFAYHLFIDPIEGAEGLASEAMMSAVAHSVCLLRVPEGTDPAAVAAAIEENTDPNKWICVGAEKVIVKQSGQIVLLVMSTGAVAEAIAANFDATAV